MQLSVMRDHVRNVVDITSNDISDSTMNTFIREGYDIIVYSEKRWPFYEVAVTFDTVASQKDYTVAEVGTNISFVHDGVTFSGGVAPMNVGIREVASMKTDNHVLEYIGYAELQLYGQTVVLVDVEQRYKRVRVCNQPDDPFVSDTFRGVHDFYSRLPQPGGFRRQHGRVPCGDC